MALGVGDAAPTELGRISGSAATINMSLLRSWQSADLHSEPCWRVGVLRDGVHRGFGAATWSESMGHDIGEEGLSLMRVE